MPRLQSTSGQHPSSTSLLLLEGDAARLSPGPGGPPPFVAAELPSSYGHEQFELLLVDPEFIFICWELTPAALDEARVKLGPAAWELRHLELRIYSTGPGSTLLSRRELYGEQGRWFIRFSQPGELIRAELGFAVEGHFHSLLGAGPLCLPRTEPVDGEYIELLVSYGSAPDGQLTIDSVMTGLGLEPHGLTLTDSGAELPSAADYGAAGTSPAGAPGSAGTSPGGSRR